MKRLSAWIMGFIFIMSFSGLGETSIFEGKPDWLQGTLCMDMYGAESLGVSWPYNHYIAWFDFDNAQVKLLKLPEDAELIENYKDGGMPGICYHAPTSYEYEIGYNKWKWRMFQIAILEKGQELLQSSLFDEVYIDAPLAILGMNGTDGIYYLGYGIAEDALKIQLNYRDSIGETTIHTFPLEYDFGDWQGAISNAGKAAWYADQTIYVTDGTHGQLLPKTEYEIPAHQLAWLDNHRLLYLSRGRDWDNLGKWNFTIRVWDTNTGDVQNLKAVDGSDVEFQMYSLDKIAVNESGNILAAYGDGYLILLNLQTGKQFKFSPWNCSIKVDEFNGRHYYGVANDGRIYFDPYADLQSKLVWCP